MFMYVRFANVKKIKIYVDHHHQRQLENRLETKCFVFKVFSFFIIISNFSNFEKYLIFCQKTSHSRWKKHFYWTVSFDTRSIWNLLHLVILKKNQVFRRKFIFFIRKTQILYLFANLTSSVVFYGKIVKVFGDRKKLSNSKLHTTVKSDSISWWKCRKKTIEFGVFSEWYSFHILNLAEI